MGYVTGRIIKELREKRNLTQKQLAQCINVSDKTISKWETDRGLPDFALIEDLSMALGVSVQELLTGECRENENPSANMKKVHFYVCPVCGNVVTSVGKGTFSCCGITLPELETETEYSEEHEILVETIEDEYLLTMKHPMTKKHYISFVAYVVSDTITVVKLYPEQDISVRFKKHGHGYFYAYCNQHGLIRSMV